MKVRTYRSPLRAQQAGDTRKRIVEAAWRLLKRQGFGGMTVEGIAQLAGVSAQTVYAIFGSKTGILTELLDQSTFDKDYEEAVRQALDASDPETRLRLAARIARQIHDAQSAVFDLLRGAGVVAPELARLESRREGLRYERQERMIRSLREARSLRPELRYRTARDIFWMLTGSDVYRMLVGQRGWSSQQYQDWLGETLARSLLASPRARQT
jgi:AcrR family transcriptional regulator